MKSSIYKSLSLTIALILFGGYSLLSQERVNPVIQNFGGIYEIPEASIKPDPKQEYKIVVDVYGGSEDKAQLDRSLNNVARMLNLHSVGGVPDSKMKVVLALHGQSTYSALGDKEYKEKFGIDNPNTPLIKELKDAGVRIAVCGQSLRSRGFSKSQLNRDVEVAVSMLTTVTHYQNLGYILLRF